jgi:hypothetical protein
LIIVGLAVVLLFVLVHFACPRHIEALIDGAMLTLAVVAAVVHSSVVLNRF